MQDQIEKAIGKPIFYVDVITNVTGDMCAVLLDIPQKSTNRLGQWRSGFSGKKTPQADVLIMGIPGEAVYGPTDNPLLAMTYITTPPRTWLSKPLVRKGGVVVALVAVAAININARPADPEVVERYQRALVPESSLSTLKSF